MKMRALDGGNGSILIAALCIAVVPHCAPRLVRWLRRWLHPLPGVPMACSARQYVAGTLLRSGAIVNASVVLLKGELHLHLAIGSHVCGHPGITHGGFIASVIDDSMGRLSQALFGNPYVFTNALQLSV